MRSVRKNIQTYLSTLRFLLNAFLCNKNARFWSGNNWLQDACVMSNMQQALLLFTENQKVLFPTFSYDRFTLIYKQKQISRMKWNQRRSPRHLWAQQGNWLIKVEVQACEILNIKLNGRRYKDTIHKALTMWFVDDSVFFFLAHLSRRLRGSL